MYYQIIILATFICFSNNTHALNTSSFNEDKELQNEPILPIPNIKISNPDIVELGKKLFLDTRLSANNTISCASCHPLANAGVDNLPTAIGINGLKGKRNTPTVYNSSLFFRQFWDGRVKTLEQQAIEPILNPIEMGSKMENVVKKLSQDPWYKEKFTSLYDDAITADNITNAIAEFERTLVTPDSPFDRYLKGDKTAIDQKTKDGYQLFKSYGCSSCHQGIAVGGNMYEKLGVVVDYYSPEKNSDNDYGRYEQTGIKEHKHEFKVPSLRNIELTAPYFHNGSITSLEKAVIIMGQYQLGRIIPKQDVHKIVLFLKSLTAL